MRQSTRDAGRIGALVSLLLAVGLAGQSRAESPGSHPPTEDDALSVRTMRQSVRLLGEDARPFYAPRSDGSVRIGARTPTLAVGLTVGPDGTVSPLTLRARHPSPWVRSALDGTLPASTVAPVR